MSKDKNKSFRRRLALLQEAREGGILFHREGGIAMSDPDVKRLVRERLLRFKRIGARKDKCLSPKRFLGNFHRDYNHTDEHAKLPWTVPGCRPADIPMLGGSLHGYVNVTRGFLTPKGEEFLARHT